MIVDPDFCDHWKTRMLVGLLEGDEAAPVYVLRLWSHCQNRRQSSFENLPAEAIKALCRYPGEASLVDSAMETAGFLHREGDVLHVCGWAEYNAALIAAWVNGGKGGRPSKNAEKHAEIDGEKPKGKPRGSRVEKSREEKIREEDMTAAQSPASRPQGGRSPVAGGPRWTPTAGWEGITDADRADWAKAYPAAVLDQELAKASEWLKANPERSKRKNWRRFLTNWLTRCQDHGGTNKGTAANRPKFDDRPPPRAFTGKDREAFEATKRALESKMRTA